MKITTQRKISKRIDELIKSGKSPLPLKVIPNQMGINLSSVESIDWAKQDDGQLIYLTINFIPEEVINVGKNVGETQE